MKRYLVQLSVTDSYWSIQVYQEAESPEQAVEVVQQMVNELPIVHSDAQSRRFVVGNAEELTAA